MPLYTWSGQRMQWRLTGALIVSRQKIHVQLSTSCYGLPLGWETAVAAVSVGKRGTGQKNAQKAVRVAWRTLPSNYNEQYGAVHTACTMGYGESIYYNDAILRST